MEGSEVAREMQSIEAACNALNLYFHGYAQKAPHWVTKMQYKTLDNHHRRLAELVGEEQATEALCETYNRVVN